MTYHVLLSRKSAIETIFTMFSLYAWDEQLKEVLGNILNIATLDRHIGISLSGYAFAKTGIADIKKDVSMKERLLPL